jgi:hypothetical protein
MVDRAETQLRKSNGSIGQTADTANAVRSPKALAPTCDAVAALPRRIDQLTRELAEARCQSGQLEAMFEKRTNRVHQLIGERDRLASLLAARDAEMLRLTREFGALAERAAPAVPRSSALLAATNALLDRFRRFRNAPMPPTRARATPASTERPSTERPLLLPSVQEGPPKAVLGVLVFGLSEPEIENALGIVERQCAERDLAPLLLTDNDAFQLFRGRRVLFEFLPPRSEQERLAPDLDWQLFTLRRLALIRRKWQPVRVLAFGRRAADIMQLWLGSPFEATPIPAPMKAQAGGADMAWGPVRQAEALQL